MKNIEAKFIKSSSNLKECPKEKLPEFVFYGRSNVGKSSLINMLVNNKNLSKISSKPGKTKLINHFIVNKNIYFVTHNLEVPVGGKKWAVLPTICEAISTKVPFRSHFFPITFFIFLR